MTTDDERRQIRIAIRSAVAKKMGEIRSQFLFTSGHPSEFKTNVRAKILAAVEALGAQFAHSLTPAREVTDYDVHVHLVGTAASVIFVPLTDAGRAFLEGLGFALQPPQPSVAPKATGGGD